MPEKKTSHGRVHATQGVLLLFLLLLLLLAASPPFVALALVLVLGNLLYWFSVLVLVLVLALFLLLPPPPPLVLALLVRVFFFYFFCVFLLLPLALLVVLVSFRAVVALVLVLVLALVHFFFDALPLQQPGVGSDNVDIAFQRANQMRFPYGWSNLGNLKDSCAELSWQGVMSAMLMTVAASKMYVGQDIETVRSSVGSKT